MASKLTRISYSCNVEWLFVRAEAGRLDRSELGWTDSQRIRPAVASTHVAAAVLGTGSEKSLTDHF